MFCIREKVFSPILRRKSFVPLDVLPYDILGATDQHRRDKAHDRPADESQDEAGLALDKEEECQADDAIELDERPQDNEEGGGDFFPRSIAAKEPMMMAAMAILNCCICSAVSSSCAQNQ